MEKQDLKKGDLLLVWNSKKNKCYRNFYSINESGGIECKMYGLVDRGVTSWKNYKFISRDGIKEVDLK